MADKTDAEKFKGLLILSSVVGAIMVIVAGLAMGKAIIIEDVQATHSRDIAALKLQIACSWKSTLLPAEERLPIYIYCKEGAVSKTNVTK